MIPGLKCREWITTTGGGAPENKSFKKRKRPEIGPRNDGRGVS